MITKAPTRAFSVNRWRSVKQSFEKEPSFKNHRLLIELLINVRKWRNLFPNIFFK